MDEYKKVLKGRLILLAICTLVALAAVILGFRFSEEFTVRDSAAGSSAGEFVLGLFTAFCALLLAYIARHVRALRSEAALKKMYISEKDERKRFIRQSALGKSFFFTTGALVVGATVASFYNETVAFTLIAVLCVHTLAGAVFKIYYLKKY